MQQHAALLVMDMQVSVLGTVQDPSILLSHVNTAISHARNKDIPVIYITVGFRTGAPEISLNNKMFGGSKARLAGVNMDEMNKIHPALLKNENEITVLKRRVSAFTGSDLEIVLRALGIRHLILTGFATSGVVLSTLREAADKDYQLTVLSDCCADYDVEVHDILMQKVFPRQAEVLDLEQWCPR